MSSYLPAAPPVRSGAALADLSWEFDLDLVNWCRCERASADSPLFGQMLPAGSGKSGTAGETDSL
jgi:hypothetical protein